jgi:hypothetical protein
MYNDKFMITEFKPKDKQLIRYTEACLFTDSPGTVYAFLQGNTSLAFQTIEHVYDVFENYKQFQAEYAGIIEPPSVATYVDYIKARQNGTVQDFTKTDPAFLKDSSLGLAQ